MVIETIETKNMKNNFLKLDISVASFQIIYRNSRLICWSSKNEIFIMIIEQNKGIWYYFVCS